MRLKLPNWLNSNVEEIQVKASRMIFMFEKYWSVIHGMLAIATILYPKFKMRLIEFYFSQIYWSHYTAELERVRELCFDLMKFYSSKSSIIEESQCSTSTSYSTSKWDGSSSKTSLANRKDGHLKFEEFVINVENDVDNVKSELDHFLDESLFHHERKTLTFCNGGYWRESSIMFFYEIAKDVLVVPIAIVASESPFRISGSHVGPHHS